MWNPLSNPELVSQLPGSPNSHEPLTHDGDSGLEINQEPRAAPSLSAFYKEEPFPGGETPTTPRGNIIFTSPSPLPSELRAGSHTACPAHGGFNQNYFGFK